MKALILSFLILFSFNVYSNGFLFGLMIGEEEGRRSAETRTIIKEVEKKKFVGVGSSCFVEVREKGRSLFIECFLCFKN